jgi:hypothetical protein
MTKATLSLATMSGAARPEPIRARAQACPRAYRDVDARYGSHELQLAVFSLVRQFEPDSQSLLHYELVIAAATASLPYGKYTTANPLACLDTATAIDSQGDPHG